MNIPGLGTVTPDEPHIKLRGHPLSYQSKPIPLPLFGGRKCRFTVELYAQDRDKKAFHLAIANFLSLDKPALKAAEEYLFQYCKDYEEYWEFASVPIAVKSPGGVWRHVHLGNEAIVTRCTYGDKRVYVSIAGGCDWEEEHGLEIVFRNGLELCRVGPNEGHLLNEDTNVILRGRLALETNNQPLSNRKQ